MLAIALAGDPQLLIADEPTTALDVTIQAQIIELLASLQADMGMGLILISHDLAVVRDVADTVVVMYAGRVAESGSCREVLEHPRHPYTDGLLAAAPQFTAQPGVRFVTMAGASSTGPDAIGGCAFAPRCSNRIDRCTTDLPPAIGAAGGELAAHRSACWVPIGVDAPADADDLGATARV